VNEKESLATSHFRANASVTMQGYEAVGRRPTRWEFTWKREKDRWRIIKTRRLHPLRDEEMEPLGKRVK
jgi:hypothetical protein